MEKQADFCALLNQFLQQRFKRTRGGAQLIADAVRQQFDKNPISRTTINNWLQGVVTTPQLWWHVGAVASVVCTTRQEADKLLQSAGHMTLADKRMSGIWTPEDGEVLAWWEQFAEQSQSYVNGVPSGFPTNTPVTTSLSHEPMLLFADDFPAKALNLMLWNKDEAKYVSVQNGRLLFDIPMNTRSDWYADILETRLRHHEWFIRIEFTVRLEPLPGQEIGYFGLQTDCDRGWLLVYVGESNPGLIIEYSKEAEEDIDYHEPIRQRVASINFEQDYKIELVWQQRQVIILLDGQQCAEIPAVPSRYLNLNAGVRPGMAVRGSIKTLRVWS